MPHAVRGVHAFRASQQTQGAIANAPFVSTSGSTDAAAGAMGPPPRRTSKELESSDDELAIPPTTPARPSSTVSSATSKRRRSALDDDTSTSSYSKRSRTSAGGGAVALHGIRDLMVDINTNMREGPLGQPRRHRRSSAERRIEATARLQEKEDLSADQIIAFADLFEQTTAKADTYMALVRDDVRKLWVQRELVGLGFPAPRSEAEV